MPTVRFGCREVHMSGLGCLVVGGKERSRISNTAELFLTRNGCAVMWRAIVLMNNPRFWLSAAHFEGSIFVAGCRGENTIEQLSFPSGQPSQWTIISTHPSPHRKFSSMYVFKGQILVSGKLIGLSWFDSCVLPSFSESLIELPLFVFFVDFDADQSSDFRIYGLSRCNATVVSLPEMLLLTYLRYSDNAKQVVLAADLWNRRIP